MDQKFIAFLLIVSFTAGYLTHVCLMKSNNKVEIVAKDDSGYLTSFKGYLENQIKENEEQKNKDKYFLDYTLTDFFSIFVPEKVELPLSTLVYKFLQIKVEKIIQGEIKSLIEAVIGLVFFYMVSEM